MSVWKNRLVSKMKSSLSNPKELVYKVASTVATTCSVIEGVRASKGMIAITRTVASGVASISNSPAQELPSCPVNPIVLRLAAEVADTVDGDYVLEYEDWKFVIDPNEPDRVKYDTDTEPSPSEVMTFFAEAIWSRTQCLVVNGFGSINIKPLYPTSEKEIPDEIRLILDADEPFGLVYPRMSLKIASAIAEDHKVLICDGAKDDDVILAMDPGVVVLMDVEIDIKWVKRLNSLGYMFITTTQIKS